MQSRWSYFSCTASGPQTGTGRMRASGAELARAKRGAARALTVSLAALLMVMPTLLVPQSHYFAAHAGIGPEAATVEPGLPGTQVSVGAVDGGASNAFVTQDNEVIVAVYLRRKTQLTDALVAYVQGDDLLVPLEELMLLLEFSVKETPTGASGWFIAKGRDFSINLKTREAVVEGKRYKLGPNDAKRIDDELFVSAKRLSKWLPIDFRANFRALRLTVSPRELLAVDKRVARSQKGFGGTYEFRSRLPRHYSPYAAAQIPSTEVDLIFGYSQNSSQLFYNGGTVRAYGDFLFMNGSLFVTGNSDGVSNARLYLGRKDPDGNLLGPLKATEYALGDVSATAVPLVSHSLSGRGARITSRASSFVAEFDRITLQGDLPDGHEVELYRNNILINAQRRGQGQIGRYEFTNVQLFRGANDIRLEFYGPQGQRRTETKSYNVGSGRVPVGKVNYDISVQEVGRSLFGLNDRKDQYSDMRFGGAARFDYGLTRNVSLTAGIVASPVPLERYNGTATALTTTGTKGLVKDYRFYGTLGLRTHLMGVAVQLDSAMDDTGGLALGFGGQTTWDKWSLALRQELFFNDYRSQASASGGSVGTTTNGTVTKKSYFRISETSANARRSFQITPNVYFGLGFGGSYSRFDNGDDNWSLRNTFDLTAGRVSFGNTLSYSGGSAVHLFDMEGSANLNLRLFNNVSLRSSAGYNLGTNGSSLHSVSLGLNTMLPYQTNFSVGYSRNLAHDLTLYDNENYYAALRRDFGWANLGLLGSYSRNGDPKIQDGLSVSLTASFSTFTDPKTLKTDVSSKHIARRGGVRVATFYDSNKNGVRDIGEELVPGAKVLVAGARQPYYTASKGSASKPLMVNSDAWMDIAIAKAGLPSSTMSPGSKGGALLPRPGVISRIELPVSNTADIEGSVVMGQGSNERVMPNVTVQVISRGDGDKVTVIKEIATEFDGQFVLSEVPVGSYLLRLEPEQAKRIGIEHPIVGEITLKADTGVVEDLKIYLNRERSQATLQSGAVKG